MLNVFKILLSAMVVLYFSACGGGGGSSDNNQSPSDTNTISHNGFTYGIVSSPITGKKWLDRNLGATKVCTKSRDDVSFVDGDTYVTSQKDCFGDYYQWGRLADGHEKRDSSAISYDVNLTVDDNGVIKIIDEESNKFIISDSSYNYDWTDKDSDGSKRKALWSKTDGTSICPLGFRVPTIDELKAETIAYTGAEDEVSGKVKVTNRDSAFKNFLKFPASGGYSSNSILFAQGNNGIVWSSSPSESRTENIYVDVSDSGYGLSGRVYAFPVRCIKD